MSSGGTAHSLVPRLIPIGRTGRAGNTGQAVSLVCVDEYPLLGDIERLLKRDITRTVIPGYEPDPSLRAEPIPKRRAARAGAKPEPRHGSRQPRGRRSGARGGASATPRSGGSASHGQPKGAAGTNRSRAFSG